MNLDAIAAIVPVDWIVITAIALLVALETFRAGSAKGVSAALSLPLSYYLYSSLDTSYAIGSITSSLTPIAHGGIFLFMCAITFFCLSRIIASFDLGGGLLPAILCGTAVVILALVVWIQTPALMELWRFNPSIETAFGELFRFYWTLAGIGLLTFARL